ncbi:CBU_0592 family membrane protein [Pedobacter sp. KLB.chiD]|uniref:CBU_0592 family membrane protein n=1 Tax=Pedobacter sp. KLB.chiD TaxID=3387402 RepID=UPI00399C23F7
MSIIGWSGVVFCTLAYLFLSMKLIRSDSFSFQALNILGGLCLAITALNTNDLPNAVANVLWMSIGLYALSKQFSKQEQKQP